MNLKMDHKFILVGYDVCCLLTLFLCFISLCDVTNPDNSLVLKPLSLVMPVHPQAKARIAKCAVPDDGMVKQFGSYRYWMHWLPV